MAHFWLDLPSAAIMSCTWTRTNKIFCPFSLSPQGFLLSPSLFLEALFVVYYNTSIHLTYNTSVEGLAHHIWLATTNCRIWNCLVVIHIQHISSSHVGDVGWTTTICSLLAFTAASAHTTTLPHHQGCYNFYTLILNFVICQDDIHNCWRSNFIRHSVNFTRCWIDKYIYTTIGDNLL